MNEVVVLRQGWHSPVHKSRPAGEENKYTQRRDIRDNEEKGIEGASEGEVKFTTFSLTH